MKYFKRHIGDYAASCAHLSMLEDGAYQRLLDAYYKREHGPTMAEAVKWARARTPEEFAAVESVLAEFFSVDEDGRYWQARVDEELAAHHLVVSVNQRIAAEREERKRARSVHEALEKREPNHEPLTTNHEPLPEAKPKAGKQKKAGRYAPISTAGWLDLEAWETWHRYRNQQKGWTADAKELSKRKLKKLSAEGHAQLAVVEQSIERGWTGLFPILPEGKANGHRPSLPERVTANVMRARAARAAAGIDD